jgi:hypothetical protein
MVVPGDSHLLAEEIRRNITIWELGTRSHGDSYPRCRPAVRAVGGAAGDGTAARRNARARLGRRRFGPGRLTVRQALHRVDGQLRLGPVQTDASVAVLPIPAPLVNILRAHRKRQLEERFAAGSLAMARHGPGLHDVTRRVHRAAQRKPHVPWRVHEGGRAPTASHGVV